MLFSIKSENLKLASRSRDYVRKSTIESLKTCQPREQNMQLSFDKRCSFPVQNSAFSLGQTRLMSGKLSRLESKHTRKNHHASGLNENGSNGEFHTSSPSLDVKPVTKFSSSLSTIEATPANIFLKCF